MLARQLGVNSAGALLLLARPGVCRNFVSWDLRRFLELGLCGLRELGFVGAAGIGVCAGS